MTNAEKPHITLSFTQSGHLMYGLLIVKVHRKGPDTKSVNQSEDI